MKLLQDRLSYLVLVVPLLILFLTSCGESSQSLTRISGKTMGTSYSVVIARELPDDSIANLKLTIDARLKELNQNLSTWIADSQLSLFNKSSSLEWVELPEELVQLVSAAAGVSRITNGAYDVSVGPIIDLWGFGAGKNSTSAIPRDDAINSVLQRVGYENLSIQLRPPALKKLRADLEVDLSSIAKGYGVDQIGVVLEANGIERYLVEIGGEVRTRGLSPRNDHWRVGIEKPDSGEANAEKALQLKDAHLATSGDYRNYFVVDGVRYSHTIDARTGKATVHSLASVTVMHDSTMLADAWATALLVLGKDVGFELAKQQSIAAYFIYRDGDEFKSRYTEEFSSVLEPD